MHTRLIGTFATAAGLVLSVSAQAPSDAAMTLGPDARGSFAPAHRHPVAIAREATKRFHSIATAKQHGYSVFRDVDGIACIAMPGMGGMGIHYANSSLVGTPTVRLKQPEALVYAPEGGRRRLVALEYLVLRKDWQQLHGPHAARPRLYGHAFNFTPAGNRFGLPPYYSLHAWIWKHNPAGRFAMWNPNVHCPE